MTHSSRKDKRGPCKHVTGSIRFEVVFFFNRIQPYLHGWRLLSEGGCLPCVLFP